MSNIEDYLTHLDGQYSWYKRKCKECGHIFPDRPKYPDFYMIGPNGGAVAKPKAQYDQDVAEYQTLCDQWEIAIKEHLKTHSLSECEFCGCVVKPRGMRNHQRSFSCKEAQRSKSLTERGLVNIQSSYVFFKEQFGVLRKNFIDLLEWDDFTTRRLVEREYKKAMELFDDLGGIVLCLTAPPVHPELGWQEVAWAPLETAAAFDFLMKSFNELSQEDQALPENREAVFKDAWNWLLMDDERRFATLGGWELAGESL